MIKHESIYLSVPVGGLLDDQDEVAKSEEWNYWAIAIQDKTGYYLWAKGVSIKISPGDLVEIIKHPFLTTDSKAYQLHQQIEIIRHLSDIGKMDIKKS